MPDREVEVLVVGAGPTGLACANLLAAAGIEVLVVEREPEGAVEPRAVSSDGGRSTVRGLLGIAMEGSSVDEPWLVVDTVGDPHHERYAMHHGDPARPHVILPGPAGRCRYEFLLLPGEDAERATDFEVVRRL